MLVVGSFESMGSHNSVEYLEDFEADSSGKL